MRFSCYSTPPRSKELKGLMERATTNPEELSKVGAVQRKVGGSQRLLFLFNSLLPCCRVRGAAGSASR